MFTDFMIAKWNIEKSFFDKEVMGYDQKTKKDIPWPWDASPSYTEYKEHMRWLDEVQNKANKQFYKGRRDEFEYDKDGNEIPDSKKSIELEPHFVRTQIVRLRTRDKKEFLYSRGLLIGYNTYQNPVTCSFQEPEKWNEQKFNHHTEFIQRLNTAKDICDGPSGVIPHYTLPFTRENVDELMKNAIPNIKLILKDENGEIKDCEGNLERFKTEDFDYILKDKWQSAEDREKAKVAYEIMQANVIAENKKKTK